MNRLKNRTTPYQVIAFFICLFSMVMYVGLTQMKATNVVDEKQASNHTVTVGYVNSSNFTEGFSDKDCKSGYGYEYLQRIAAVTGWKYEYVYGGWTDILNKLENGEVDMMVGMTYTEERAKRMDFSEYPMGFEHYYIYAYEKQPFVTGGIDKIKGARIGCVKDSMQNYFLEKWNGENKNICNIVTFDSNEQMYESFESYEIEAVVDTDNAIVPEDMMIPVINVGESDYYIAVAQNKPELLGELNDALSKMNTADPYLNDTLHYKYFSESATRMTLTKEEKKWLEDHSTVRIAYEKDFLAFCDCDRETGELKGVLKTFVDYMEENFGKYGVRIETVAYNNVEDSISALRKGEVDVVFPLYQSLYEAEKHNLLLSDSLFSTGMTAIVSSQKKFDESKDNIVAITKGFTDIEWYIREEYPNWEIKICSSFDACIDAVKNGDADCVVESTYVYKNLVDYRTVEMVALSVGANVSFVVNRNNKELLSILNRAVSVSPKSGIVSTMTAYANADYKTTFDDFARDNILILGITIIVVVFILLFIMAKAVSSAQKARKAEKEKEQQLMQIKELNAKLADAKRKAEAANNAKTTFLFNMSHDIRTPMNAIIGFTNLMEKNIEDKEKLKDYIAKMQSSNTFLLSLINNVLEMARIESGKMSLELSYWDIDAFHDTLNSVFSESMHAKNLRFIQNIKIEHRGILCDSTKVREVFLNLISNSVKYTPDGGLISLELTEMPSKQEGYAVYKIVIKDTGIGMSKEYVEKIFDEFSRERTSTECGIEGSGLGMAIVKKLVDFMDGTIEVESELGKGTEITVIFKFQIASEEDKPIAMEEKEEFDKNIFVGKRILLAEDNELNAEIAKTIFEDAGFYVEWAEDGVICVDMVDKKEAGYYDLIVMDIQMPNMDGYEATKEIRKFADEQKANIPIVALTANAFKADRENAMKAGMNGHMAKPINVQEMWKIMAAILEKKE